MTDSTTVKAKTNTAPRSCVDVHCDCNTIWSLGQQFSYLRLSDEIGPFRAKLVSNYGVRARRIAATYARFYLETEAGGDIAKKGRFYWMALGAFASKTVACALDTWQISMQSMVVSDSTREGLGKGNFWLFGDISVWHWYYCNYRVSFDACLESRNANNYTSVVKQQLAKLPWASKALPAIKQFAVSDAIKTGFAKVEDFEAEDDARLRLNLQLQHLLAIADHEQLVILQPLIYSDPEFVRWLRVQRSTWVNWASPSLELVFEHGCRVDDVALKSTAPAQIELEDARSRMAWIANAAQQFHRLMQEKKGYMEREIQIMAGWVGTPDR